MNVSSKQGNYSILGFPDTCPFCHKSITPNIIYGYKKDGGKLHVFLSCPDPKCLYSFIGEYGLSGSSFVYSKLLSKGNIISENFKEVIYEVSNTFVTIYNQAFFAEQEGLLEICGVGYRKALEFLIKDYSIFKHPEKIEEIENKLLAKCINDYVDDNRIKKVAKRATWLGNDETHYVRKWEGKNLSDLKTLIQLTLHWIEMEKLTADFERDMPD